MSRVERIGDATLYLGDCMDVLPQVEDVDCIVTDPPYGINAARARNSQKDGWVDYGVDGWDKERPGREVFDAMLRAAPRLCIWGGNYFTDYLPPSQKWLSWDKGQDGFSLADFELAWTSENAACRRLHYPRALALKDGKEHPTQKPLDAWKHGLVQVTERLRFVARLNGIKGCSKVNSEQRQRIAEMFAQGVRQHVIAATFGITQPSVSRIVGEEAAANNRPKRYWSSHATK